MDAKQPSDTPLRTQAQQLRLRANADPEQPSLASRIRALHRRASIAHRDGASAEEWEAIVGEARALAEECDREVEARSEHRAPYGDTWEHAARRLRAVALGANARALHVMRSGDVVSDFVAVLTEQTDALSAEAAQEAVPLGPEELRELAAEAEEVASGWRAVAERCSGLWAKYRDRALECRTLAQRCERRARVAEDAATRAFGPGSAEVG